MQLHLVARLAFKTNSPPHLPIPRASGLGTLTRLLTWNVVWLIFSPANTIQINHYRYSQTFGKFSLLTSLETRRHTLTYIHRQRKSIHYFSTSIPGWHKRGVVGHFSSQEMLCINWYQHSQNIWKIHTKTNKRNYYFSTSMAGWHKRGLVDRLSSQDVAHQPPQQEDLSLLGSWTGWSSSCLPSSPSHLHHHHYHISVTITITSSWTSSPIGS